ncbi:MAG TPA: cyclic nucleotide-binding domain-containing protein [Anaerolineae bacterium]|jgi:CRP/FNR family transcriptional regulator|nr:cyclic nucleotide-binding domain-containing protein [Anaerolineae bacterium]
MTDSGALGKIYKDRENIVRQGEIGECMYVIQEGLVEVVVEEEGQEILIAIRGEGEFFGEMAIFERELRMATVRALGEVRVLTIDEKNFLKRIHEDPSLAYRIVRTMSQRIRALATRVASVEAAGQNQS